MATLAHPRRVPPEQMTGRARAYLTIAAARHIAVAWCVWTMTARFTAPVFDVVAAIMPLWTWGVVFFVAGATCGMAALLGRESLARTGLILSATSTGVWGAAFVIAIFTGPPSVGILGAIFLWALTAKDLVVCRQPLRSPFESLIKDFAATSRAR